MESLQIKHILLILLMTASLTHVASGDRLYESCTLNGWTDGKTDKLIHYSVRLLYNPPKRQRSGIFLGGIRSIKVQYGKTMVTFPSSAFSDYSSQWRTPSYFGYSYYGNCYQLAFYNCGDGAKSYMVEFSVHDGRLVDRHLIPEQLSELHDKLLIFDPNGKVVYNGPCDRQGKPTRSVH